MKSLDPLVSQALKESLSGSELTSVLLDVMAHRAQQRSAGDLLHQWQEDRFVQPALVDPRTALEIDQQLFRAAHTFEAIELAPVAPLGVCSVLAPTSQNRVVATARGSEVVSDPTNVLALECARRLREQPESIARFATSHRCVRAQPFPKRPGFAAHFRMFCLATAGRERPNSDLTVNAMREQIAVHLDALARLKNAGYALPNVNVTLRSTPDREQLARRIGESIRDIPVRYEALEHAYYAGLRFLINVGEENGSGIPLIDGGCFDWVGRLLANRKFSFVASGLGSQLIAYAFPRTADASVTNEVPRSS